MRMRLNASDIAHMRSVLTERANGSAVDILARLQQSERLRDAAALRPTRLRTGVRQ
jgi:hypothetical protein